MEHTQLVFKKRGRGFIDPTPFLSTYAPVPNTNSNCVNASRTRKAQSEGIRQKCIKYLVIPRPEPSPRQELVEGNQSRTPWPSISLRASSELLSPLFFRFWDRQCMLYRYIHTWVNSGAESGVVAPSPLFNCIAPPVKILYLPLIQD